MPLIPARAGSVAALVGLAVVAGCGGCSGGNATRDAGAHDAGKWCDGGCPPPPAKVAWDHAVLPTPHDQISICGAVVLPTGIAILAPPYIVLADKTDGHLIAKAPWPVSGNNYPLVCQATARSDGDLDVLTEDRPTSSSEEMTVHEYAGADLSPVKTTVLSKQIGGCDIGELKGGLYVLERPGATSLPTLYLYSVVGGGSAQA